MTHAPGTAERSDRELVLAFQAGDDVAFDELYRRHRERVAKVCYRFMNNRPDAEEAAQEAFLKAFQALPRFNGQYQVGAWLTRIAANVCVDNLRVRSRTHLVALPGEEKMPEREPGPEDILVGEHPEVDVAITEMQPLHADALRMRAVDGLSHIEMANRLDMSPPQVKALLHRARSSFKRAWDKAQGWLLAPVIGIRSLDRSSQVSNSPNLAVLSAQAPALAERAAASVLIMVVAMSGSGASLSTGDAPAGAGGHTRVVALDDRNDLRPVQVTERAAVPEETRSTTAATGPGPAAEGELIALPDILTSTIEGKDKAPEDDGNTDDRSDNEQDFVPPTVKERQGEAVNLVKETLTNLDE